jgi:peptidoglycan/xylan/chitin deacetylase (PgdA/CDA1 family)
MIPLLLAGAAAAAASVAAWGAMAPRSQLFGQAFCAGQPGSRRLALTFDDGPNDPHTLHLLDVLGEAGVRATFFCIGQYAARRPDVLRRMVRGGHVLGNHTFSHPNLLLASPLRLRAELRDCQRALSDAAGVEVRLFRPPFGARRPEVLRVARDEEGLETVLWSLNARDYTIHSAELVRRRVLRSVRRNEGGDVILMHDGDHRRFGGDRAHTVRAVEVLVEDLLDDGYEFVTVPQLMAEA